MTLVTSFSLEELERLRGLPEMPVLPRNYTGEEQRDNWVPVHAGPPTFINPRVEACRSHDLFGHIEVVDGEGIYYYRHGEALARITDSGQSHFDSLYAWLDAIHAHEAAR